MTKGPTSLQSFQNETYTEWDKYAINYIADPTNKGPHNSYD